MDRKRIVSRIVIHKEDLNLIYRTDFWVRLFVSSQWVILFQFYRIKLTRYHFHRIYVQRYSNVRDSVHVESSSNLVLP